MIDTQIKQDYVIVYNKMNLAAVIATAICLNELPGAIALDVAQVVPSDSKEYIWIGIDPKVNVPAFWHHVKNQEHTVLIDNVATKPLSIQLNPFKTKFPEEETSDNPDLVSERTSIVLKACEYLCLKDEIYKKLDFQISRFYDRGTELEYLAFVYCNLLDAQIAIDNSSGFTVRDANAIDVTRYLSDIKRVKSKFNNAYVITKVIDGDNVKAVLQTAFSDFTIHLALRLSKLVRRNFLNMTMGLSGAIAYTNMRYIVFDDTVSKPMVLN